jgi:hypothetical protein
MVAEIFRVLMPSSVFDFSLSTNVIDDEALQVIRNNLNSDHTLAEWYILQVTDIIELLKVCLRSTIFQVHYKFSQQKWHKYGKLSVTSH